MKKILISIFIILFFSCKKEKVEGIIIGYTLLTHQSISENRKLENYINQALKKDKKAIIEIINFPNGGAASSYDLGYVLTQVIYKIGENNFAEILKDIPISERKEVESLIDVGLEYGDNDYNGEMDNKRMETEFPLLTEILNKDN